LTTNIRLFGTFCKKFNPVGKIAKKQSEGVRFC